MKLQNLLPAFALVLLFPLVELSANYHLTEINCNQTIYLEGATGRKAIYLPSETETIELCGLIPNQEYIISLAGENGCDPNLGLSPMVQNSNELIFTPLYECAEITISLIAKKQICGGHLTLSYATKNKKKSTLNKMLAPISVIGGVDATTLVEDIFIGGGCFEVSNAVRYGNSNAAGIFSGGLASLGIDEGVILSTGNVTNAQGPNIQGSISTNWNGQPGDNDLNDVLIANGDIPDTEDRVALEFDFTPTVDMIQFNYVFGSDEYCEWVNTDYTDIFGFFISGPGINGGFTLGAENIALIPGTGTSVSINTVNNVDNSGFFIPNRAGTFGDGCGGFTSDDVEFDGWTTMFTAVANVQACETYHIKLVIADNRDGTLDSAVFLEANSFAAGVQAEGEAISSITGSNIVYEQCPDGSFVFNRAPGSSLDEDIVITYTISGTATPGSDYDPLPFSVTIPAGQTSVTLPVNIIPDALIEGQESIILTLDNPCNCSGILVEMFIEDSLPMEASMEDQEVCGTGNVTLSPTITGGVGTFTYMWDTGASGPSITVSPTEPTTYIVTVTDECMNTDTASATVIVSQPPTAEIDGMYNLCEGATPPTVDIPVTFTGNPPWTFNYTIGGVPQPSVTTSDNPYFLTVVLTGDVSLVDVSTGTGGSCPGTVMGSVTTNLITISANIETTPEQCEGANDGTITVTASGGTEPYSYDWSNGGPDSPMQTDLPAGSYSVIVTDADGCTTNASATIDPANPLTASLNAIEANCTNGGNGNITLTVNGGNPNYTYAWSDGSSDPNLSNATAGTYTVTVTDMNGCTAEATADIADNTTPPDAVANGMGIIDCNNEEMEIDGIGSSTGSTITYQWSGPGIVSGGTTLNPTINAGGTYTILVTDTNSGCTAEATVDIMEDMNEPDAVANLGPFDCATSTLELDGNGSSTGSEFTYQWTGPGIVSGGTTLNPTIDQAGTYTILVTNTINGCTAEASVSPNPPEELTASLTSMEANCTNNGGGNITLTVGGGTPTYTYAWSDGSSGPNLSNAPAGTYTVTVTDDNGCTAEATADIADNTTPPDAVANGMGIIDCNNEEMEIDGNGSSTGSTITYQWSGPGIVSGGTTLNPTINAGGTYMIIVTDTNSGCTAEATVDIMEDMTPPDAVASGGELDCNNEIVIVDGIGSSQGGEYTYQWSGPGIISGGTTLTPEVDQSGTYTILVTNTTNGCTAEASTNITDNSIDPTAVANFTNLTCANTTVELNGQGSTTGSGITYQWTGPGLIAGETTLNPTIDEPGTYELIVTNGNNGCSATVSVNVQEDITPPNIVIQDPDDLGCLVTEIDLTSNGSSTGPTMVYNWNGPGIVSGGGSNSPTVNQPGTYTLFITNTANGCTAEASVEVIENIELPTVEIADPDVIDCNNPTIMLDGTGSTDDAGTTYQWSGPSVVSGENTLTPEVDQTGTYTLIVTNSLGCTAAESINVSDNLNYPFADAGPPQTITCTETTVFLDGIASDMGPNITYQWFDENGNPVPNGTNNSIETGQTGTYEIVVTEAGSGCTSSAFVTVDANSNVPVAEIFPPDLLTCAMTEVTLNATITNATNVSAVWSTIDGEIISGGNTLTPTVGQVGIYEVVLTDEDSGCTAVASTEVMIDDMPPIAVIQDPPVLGCIPTAVSLSGVGSTFDGVNQTYIWSDNIVGNQGTLGPLIIDPGIYTLTVVNDLNGCTAVASVEVLQEIIEPEITIADPDFLNCFNNEITLDATGSDDSNGTTYQWFDENNDEINDADELTLTVMQGGTFTLVVTTFTGCTSEMSVTVDEDLVSPTADAGPNQMITCTESMVTLDGSNSSTGPQFGYQWLNANGNEVEDDITFLTGEAGTYELVVTNLQNGCTANEFVTVSANSDVPTISVEAPEDLDCIFTEINLNATTNSTDIVIEWTTDDGEILNGENTLTPTVGQPGTYEIIITDNGSGCTAVGSAIVVESIDLPVISIANPEELDCTNPTTFLDASMSSNNGNFQYDWSTVDGNILSGQNTLEPEIDAGGFYTLTILNMDNGCESFETVEVEDNTLIPTIEIEEPDMITCTVSEVGIFANNSSTGSNLTYEWTTSGGTIINNGTTLNPTVGSAGTYTLVITNSQNGCTATESIEVEADANIPQADAGPASLLDCLTEEITLAGTATGGANLTYEWTTPNGNISAGNTTLSPTIDAAGTYILNVINPDNNCETTSQVIIEEDTNIPVVDAGATAILNCNNPTLNLDGTGSDNGTGLNISWTTSDGNIVNGANTLMPEIDESGTYVLTIANPNNNCSATEEVIINENFVLPNASAGAPQTMGCGVDSLTLNGTANSTNNPFLETTWTTSDGNILTNDSTLNPTIDAAGTYTLTVLDQTNGCTATAFVDISQNMDIPTITIGPDGEITCTTTNLDLTATVDGNTSNFVYEWTTPDGNIAAGANTLTPNVDAAGMYQLIVTDTINNCTDMAMLNVTEDANIPQADIEPAGALSCNSTAVTLDASNSTTGTGITYEWTTQDGNFTGGQTTLSPTIDAPGLYTLTVIDANNDCINSTGITVEMDTLVPTVIPQADGVLTCEIEEINLDGSNSTTDGDLTYLWTTADGEILNGEDGLNPLIGAAGTYTLTIIDNENGCDNSADILVEASADVPMIAIEMPAEINCLNDTISLDATNSDGGATYEIEWTTTDGNLVNLDNPLEPVVDASGVYNLLITNTLTGCSATQEIEVFENQMLPIAEAGEEATINCYESAVDLNGIGSSEGTEFSYTWTTVDGNITANANSLNPTIDSAGIYQLLVTNQINGCTSVAEVAVLENTTPPDAVIADPEILNCYQDTLNLDAAASSQGTNFLYEWTTTNGNIISGENTLTPEIDVDGFYQILITNEINGCTATFSTQVTNNFETPLADAGPEFELSCGNDDVTLDGGLSTVDANVTYEWVSPNGNILSGQNALDPTVNATGIYMLIVTNTESGCSAISETEVTQDDNLPNADAGTADPITCNVLSVNLDGTNSDNGTGFTFEWTTSDGSFEGGENTLTPTVNSPGVYVLTITNEDNDCSTVSSVTVSENTNPPLAEAGNSEELSCAINELSLDGGNSASGNGFSYEWTTVDGNILDGETTLTPDIDSPGTYQILVTDLITGCTATDEVEVTESLDMPVVIIAEPNELTCAELSVALDADSSSQGTNITYEWVTTDGNILVGGNTTTPTINEPGTYEIIVTDTNNGCTNSSVITVSQNVDAPNAEAGDADELDCDTDVISLNGEGSTTGPNVMYEWSTMNGEITAGGNTLTPTVGAVGEYQIEVMNMDNGCSSMDMVIVESDEDLPLTVIANPEELTCTDEVVVLNGENSDTGPNFEFEWTTQGGNILNAPNSMNLEVDAAGTYTLTITNNENGCTETASVIVDEDVEAPTAEAGTTFTLDCLQDVEYLDGSADGNGAAILTNWTTTNGVLQSGINTLSPGISQAGIYTLTVTNLENGCTAVDEVLIETDGPIGSFFTQDPLCYNTPGAISFQNIQGGEAPYVYSIDGGNSYFDSGFFPNLPAGQYSLVVQDANGCEHLETTQITQPEEVIVKVTIDEAIISLGDDFQIVAQTTIPESEIDTIIWTPDNTLSCGDCLTPVATPDAATVYSVVVTDHNGCSGQDALFLSVEKNREVHAPNAFSPNGDGENDVFMLFTDDKSVKKIKSFLVFNRWGETVYQYHNFDPNQPAFGWDGSHRGQLMNPAVFAWFAEVEFVDGSTKLFEGDVTLMR